MINNLISVIIAALTTISPVAVTLATTPSTTLSVKQFSLDNRYAVKSVNEVMKKNILLNVAYLDGTVKDKQDINWDQLTSDTHSEFILKPNESFAYHDIIRPEFESTLALTQTSSFSSADGYLSDGYLYGDGVCHLASLINWAAIDAGLTTLVPKDHRSVSTINEIPDDYGVSIYKDPTKNIGANNNLYITNNLNKAVKFSFDYQGSELKVTVSELS